jgi:hypothetical protein
MNKKSYILACLLIVLTISSIAYAGQTKQIKTDAEELGIPIDPNVKVEEPETGTINAIDPDYAPWTAAGTTGIVDESDYGIVDFIPPSVRVYPYIPVTKMPAYLDLYYNVEAVDGLTDGRKIMMKVRYVDNGPDANVIVRLKEANQNNGIINTRINFNSDSYGTSPYVQSREISTCSATSLDFRNNVYWIEAVLTKKTTSGTPVLVGIKLDTEPC